MPTPQVLKLDNSSTPADTKAEEYFLAPEKLIAGNPKQTLWLQYTDPSRQFMAGIWRSEPGKWRVSYTEEEYCHMLEGVSVICSDEGHSITVKAGDSFVMPRGFVGSWEVIEPSCKRFVIYEASA